MATIVLLVEPTTQGTPESDMVIGTDEAEFFSAGEGDDDISGGGGADTLIGDAGNDIILGEAGNDIILGLDGDDDRFAGLVGGPENDIIAGNRGNDRLTGDAGNDTLFGGKDNDTLTGGEGDDILSGDLGSDTLIGDELSNPGGVDTFVLRPDDPGNTDVIEDFQNGEDLIGLTRGLAFSDLAFSESSNGNIEIAVASSGQVLAILAIDPLFSFSNVTLSDLGAEDFVQIEQNF